MKGLGYLEETILLLLMIMEQKAYGVTVREEYEKQMGKKLTLSAIHAVLSRLEKKGYISSFMGEPTTERGGRRKRIFEVTSSGKAAIEEIKASRQKLWNLIPDWK